MVANLTHAGCLIKTSYIFLEVTLSFLGLDG